MFVTGLDVHIQLCILRLYLTVHTIHDTEIHILSCSFLHHFHVRRDKERNTAGMILLQLHLTVWYVNSHRQMLSVNFVGIDKVIFTESVSVLTTKVMMS